MNGGTRWVLRAGQVVLVLLVAWGIYRAVTGAGDFEWRALTMWRPSPGPLLLSLTLLIGVYIAHALLWRRVMIDLRVARPPVHTTLRVYFLAGLGRYIPGKVWQLAGVAILAGKSGLPAGGAAASALLGQFAFLATGFLFLAVLLPEWNGGPAARVAGVLLVAAAGGLWVIAATPRGQRIREWARTRFGENVAAAIDLAERIRGWDTILWGVWYGLTWVLTGIAFSLFVSSFVPGAGEHARQLAGSVAASYLVGYLVLFAPAGIGVREGAMASLLAAVPSVPLSAAVTVAVASRIWFTLAELAPLLVLPLLSRGAAASDGPPEAVGSSENRGQGGTG